MTIFPTRLAPLPVRGDYPSRGLWLASLRAWVIAGRGHASRGPIDPPPMPTPSDFEPFYRFGFDYQEALSAWTEVCGDSN